MAKDKVQTEARKVFKRTVERELEKGATDNQPPEHPFSRREVLAFIALQDLPMPAKVEFHDYDRDYQGKRLSDSISIDLGNDVSAFHAWCASLDAGRTNVRHQHYVSPPEQESGRNGELWNATVWDQWGGWLVHLHGFEPNAARPEPPLDDETVSRLREISGGEK